MLPAVLRRSALPIAATLVAATLPVLAGGSASAGQALAPLPVTAVAPAARADDDAVALSTPLASFRLREDGPRRINVAPRRFVAARVDLAAARGAVAGAPTVAQVAGGAAPVRISLPAPDGTLVEFAIAEDSVMEPALQARHPELRTYAGRGITDPTDTIRFDITPLGLHAAVRSVVGARSWYVDPAYYGRGVTSHLSYTRASVPARDLAFVEQEVEAPGLARRQAEVTAARREGEVVVQRTYRMAWVTTPSYATDFGTANVMAEKVRVINRTNEIYMDDLAIKFVLVDGTDKLNFDTLTKATGADGACGADPCFAEEQLESCGGTLNDINFVTGAIIGADNYDIGHLGSGGGSGGVARLAAVGGEFKSSGCTALDEPRGDFYAVDFFAHEVGHQMAGNHTFDGVNGSCAPPNRSSSTSVEPGSGSTVMAYAGICFNDDLQRHTDPYFSQRSIDEITANSTKAPTLLTEVQMVSLKLFSGSDSFVLGYPGATPVTITNGVNYNAAGLQTALTALTGKTGFTITGYHAEAGVSANGFTVEWPDTTDAERLTVTDFVGATGFQSVMVEGGQTGNQGTTTSLTNHRPQVDAGLDKTIPVQTPFQLSATATDADAGQLAGLTYLWEQNDNGNPGDPILETGPGTSLASPLRTIGPLFRVFGTFADVSDTDTLLYNSPGQNLADGSPSRSFPDLAQVVAGNTNAEGPCPVPTTDPTSGMEGDALDCLSEYLPDPLFAAASGELNFRVTARDGDPTGGGTDLDDVVLTVDPSAGPFLVTSRGTAGSTAAMAGTDETVTWDAAGTNSAVFATTVRITVSTDGGLTFPHVGIEETNNDGSAIIQLPNVNTTSARIKVEAVGNYFYDVNNADFTIEGGVDPTPPQTTITGGLKRRGFLVGASTTYPFESTVADSTFSCTLDGDSVPCGSSSVTLSNLKAGTHRLLVTATSPGGVADATPAKREFTVVANEGVLTRVTKGWKRAKDSRFYQASYLTTNKKDQVLSINIAKMTRYSVLVARGKNFGRVAVFINDKRVRTLKLDKTPLGLKVLLASGNLTPRDGKLTLKTLDNKPVIIDGVGVRVLLP